MNGYANMADWLTIVSGGKTRTMAVMKLRVLKHVRLTRNPVCRNSPTTVKITTKNNFTVGDTGDGSCVEYGACPDWRVYAEQRQVRIVYRPL